MVNLGFADIMFGSNAQSVNYDGTVIAGRSVMPPTITKSTIWKAPDYEPQVVGPNLAEQQGVKLFTIDMAGGVSDDGTVVVGTSQTAFINNGAFQPYIWHEGGEGMVSLIHEPYVIETTYGNGRGVSADGTVAFGWYRPHASMRAFRWTEETGIVFIGTLGGHSDARAMTRDGNIIVGNSGVTGSPISRTAFMWSEDTGIVNKGFVVHNGAPANTVPLAVSDHGARVVGYHMELVGTCPQSCAWVHHGAIWDQDTGWRDLQLALEQDYDLFLFGWSLGEARGISADGRFIVGEGTNPFGETEAWIVELPAPPGQPTCPGDLTGSGHVGVPDLLQLLSCWGPVTPGSACAAADLTSSGGVGVPDLLQLLANWGPCP